MLYDGQERLYDDIRFEQYLLEIHLHSFGNINITCQTVGYLSPSLPKQHGSAVLWALCSAAK